jgi:hypothetical protein
LQVKEKKLAIYYNKLAINQQAILNKLAQSYADSGAADAAMSDFVKYQFTSWAMPREVEGRLQHTVERDTSTKHYNVDAVIVLSNPEQKSLVEDPANGFAAWLTKKLATAPSVEKWKSLAGCTATFNVTTK